MKLFLDSVHLDDIRAAASLGVVDGVTTNPKLLARQELPLDELIPKICTLIDGPISVPVRSEEHAAIVEEARALAALHDNVIVKIPVHVEGLRAMSRLQRAGVRTHATLCCSANQALLAAKCGAYFVSPFIGRLDGEGQSGIDTVARIIDIYDNYDFETQIMVASINSPLHVQDSAALGADACTVSWSLFQQLYRHPMTDFLQEDQRAAWTRS